LARKSYSLEEFRKQNDYKTTEPPPPKKNPPQKKFFTQPKKNSPTEVATAPYNFVSLPEKVLPAPLDDLRDFAAYMESNELFSGEILLDIEALTPLFIGIGGNESKTFAPIGTPIIPGSTLRGMFKNIFKIVTCGAFRGKGEDFNDEHIYFRCLMKNNHAERADGYNWSRDLNNHYVDLMTDKSTGKKNARPGFLVSKKGKFFIVPSKNHRKDDYLMISEFQERYGAVDNKDSRVFWGKDDEIKRAYCLTGNQFAKQPWKLMDRTAYQKYKATLAELHAKLKAGKISKKDHAFEVRRLNRGKQIIRYTSLDYVDWNGQWLELSDEAQNAYRADRNRIRSSGVNLFNSEGILKGAELKRRVGSALPDDVDSLIPCHYIADGKSIKSFGHGQCFRIPYQNPIGAAVKISGNEAIDFSDLVFGTKTLASRVYFEDATPENFSELQEEIAHPLMQPNPTSYQLYLKQEQNDDKLKHWDTIGAQIRGYKLYWHKPVKPDDWQASQSERKFDKDKPADKRLTKKMTPLGKGSKFKAKIRFKNLTAIELGALMMIFDLDGLTTAAYKIGQGKPFGFGSVKVTPTLFIEDAYDKLFDADGWKNPCREEKPTEFLNAFKNYIQACGMEKSWGDVIDELGKILNWDVTEKISDWRKRIQSMSGDVSNDSVDERFIKRVPLQKISEVLK